jgi:ATP sulfurylase
MEPVKTDQILYCDQCGVELQVVKNCDETCACNITCCGQPMKVKASEGES